MRSLREFFTGERGQDLAEYCLLTALIALVAVGILIHVSGGMSALWGTANTSLASGSSAVGASGASGAADVSTSAPAK